MSTRTPRIGTTMTGTRRDDEESRAPRTGVALGLFRATLGVAALSLLGVGCSGLKTCPSAGPVECPQRGRPPSDAPGNVLHCSDRMRGMGIRSHQHRR